MNRQRRAEAKKKRREREDREARHRRADAQRCALLLAEADATIASGGSEDSARRLLEKALRLRPGSNEVLERLAPLHIRHGRFAEGFELYERMTRPPEWPAVTYLAATAAYNLGRFDAAHALARQFLKASAHFPELATARADAKRLGAQSAREARARRAPSTGPPGPSDSGVQQPQSASRPPARPDDVGQPRLPLQGSATARTSRRPAHDVVSGQSASGVHAFGHVAAPAPSRNRSEDVDDLPPFPVVSVPDPAVQIVVDGLDALRDDGRIVPAVEVLLRRDYAALKLQRGFDELIAMATVKGVEGFWFQLETVRRVLRDFRGRVLLADEVGLGKTIEACLALKEYWLRGLVRKALVLAPAALVSQWVDELTSKFNLAPAVVEAGRASSQIADTLRNEALVVASLPLLRLPPHRALLATIEYDLVIVDEAHTLKNRASAAFQLVNDLKKRFLFLLSATPVGNNLTELYNLILLLKPGLLRTEAQFRREFGGVAALEQPERRERLRELLREVMIRNTRAHIDLKLPRRLAATEIVQPTPAEIQVQESIADYVRDRYAPSDASARWRLMSLQAQASSSPAALRGALDRSRAAPEGDGLDAVRDAVGAVTAPTKTRALIDLARRSGEKKIVFTRFVATVEHLREALTEAGFRVAVLHGGMTAAEKDRAVASFAEDAEILVSSEVGSEGRNLQFCRTVVNYDLPWNPVQLEQRVGRVHRIGQTRDVFVFNLCLAGSLEEYVLEVLHDKLNLFELVAGEVEMILGELDDDQDFAAIVMELWARSATHADREQAFQGLGEAIAAARARYERTQALDRALFSEEFEV